MTSGSDDPNRGDHLQAASTVGLETVKSLFLLNGGAALASLTLFGQMGASKAPNVSLAILKLSVGAFAAGAALSVTSMAVAYIALLLTVTGSRSEAVWRLWSVLVGLLSMIGFALGTWWAVHAFK